MARVTCKIPGTAGETIINGVKFEPLEDHIISEEISDAQAAYFTGILGYALAVSEDTELAALTEQAVALGIKVDTRWKAQRLTAEIEKANAALEKSAADAAAAQKQDPAA